MRGLAHKLEASPRLVQDAENALRVGVHWGTQARPPHTHRVCQVYASALPVAYGHAARSAEWEPFARLVLRAAYEATLAVGALKARESGRRQAVYLTSLGGGAFGNRDAWITEAVRGALHKFRDAPLDVYKVHYGTRVQSAWRDVGSEYPEPTPRGARGEYHNLVADHHSPHEHTDMEDWPLAKLRERLAAAPAEAPLAAVVTTGAMNPPHAGHAQMLHQAAARLQEDGFDVVGAWVSPSHDGYVQPKAWSLRTIGLSAAFRLKLADHATEDDRLVAVGAWEAQQPGEWPDYPLVAKALRERLHALAVPEDGALSRLRDARVFYVCGTDHAQKCGLYGGGLKHAAGVGTVVVPRAGDTPSEQGGARAVAGWGPYIAQPAAGDVASFSSTRVRSAIAAKDADAVRTMLSASAARFLLQPTAEEHECYSADYEKLGVSPPPPTSTEGVVVEGEAVLEAEVDRANEDGTTQLYAACEKGHVDAARLLLDKGADVNRANKDGWTPLYVACLQGHVDAARLLLDNGADVNRANKYGATPLFSACYNGHVDAARLVLDKGAEVDRGDALYIACQNGHVYLARLLLDKRADINRANEDGATPLFIACQQGRVYAARLLLEKGAEVDRAKESGQTPLWIACSSGRVDLARLLLDNGAEVDRADEDGETPLYSACQEGYVDVVRLLLNKGADVDRANQNGATPLDAAKEEGDSALYNSNKKKVVALLAEHHRRLLEAPMMEAEPWAPEGET